MRHTTIELGFHLPGLLSAPRGTGPGNASKSRSPQSDSLDKMSRARATSRVPFRHEIPYPMTTRPPRAWQVGDKALVHRERVTVREFIDHGGPGPLDEVLVEYVASGEERTVPRDALSSLPDLVQGARATGEVYLAGGRLDPTESLSVAAHSPQGFWWGNVGAGATQLALDLLLRAADRDTALAYHVALTWQVIARLPQGDSELPMTAMHDWLASRRGSEITRRL